MHNIEYFDYKENVDQRKVANKVANYIEENGEYGGEGVRWCRETICADRDEAEKWISSHDKGWYDQLAVRYYHAIPTKTKKLEELDQKIQEAYKVYNEKDRAVYVKTRTSEFIGCGNCKSRLASKLLNGNFCPVCRADLRPETTLKSIAAAKNKWETAQKTRKEYINTHSKKEICWLVKIEYHT